MGALLIGPGGEVDVSDRADRALGRITDGATEATLVQIREALPASPETGLAKDATLAQIRDRTPFQLGTAWYRAGTGGTLSVGADQRILGISAYANAADGSFTVDGGDAIQVRSGVGREWNPLGNLVGPLDIVFDASLDWIVEGIE